MDPQNLPKTPQPQEVFGCLGRFLFFYSPAARGEFEEALLEVEQEEDTETIHDDLQEGEGDALLATVLCSAYPGNVAMRSSEKRSFKRLGLN